MPLWVFLLIGCENWRDDITHLVRKDSAIAVQLNLGVRAPFWIKRNNLP